MCTLTFIPSATNNVIITSNRDEHVSRGDTKFPVSAKKGKSTVVFPQDPKAGGTWVASSSQGIITVLLNGAFEKHKHRPPYRLSRGIVVLDTFDYSKLKAFSANYELEGIEPFTLVQFDTQKKVISEIRWDGFNTFYSELDYSIPHIWSSATLYSKEVRTQRAQWFSDWLKTPILTPEKMLEFHKFGGNDSSNSISMNRGNGLQTVSISQIEQSGTRLKFTHHNLLNQASKTIEI